MAPAISGNISANASLEASETPRSVIKPVISRLGVTSNAGLPPGTPSEVTLTSARSLCEVLPKI